MSERRLGQLVRDCLTQIDSTDGRPAGSGFFAASGYVLTCSHVVNRPAQSPITGQWHGGPWSGTVVLASPAPPAGSDNKDSGNGTATIWPEPDLAIIRLEDDIAHPCVRLGSAEPECGSHMVTAGRRQPFGHVPGDFFSATTEYTGKFLYLMRLKNENFGRGLSGGPILDLTNGEVCGVAKLAGPEQDGYAVPIQLAYDLPGDVAGEMVRSHDRYHDDHREWVRAQRALWDARPSAAAALLPPDSEAELLGLLARLPRADPATLGLLYRECADRLLLPGPGPLRELRDVALALADLLHERDRPHPVIIFAELLAASLPALTTDLRDWSTAEAIRQGSWELLRNWRASPARTTRHAGTETNPMSMVIQRGPRGRAPDPQTLPGGHAFISYVRENKPEVDWLQEMLEAAGIRVWRDTADLWPGQDWRAKIRHAIVTDALVFLACFSSNGLARRKSYQNEEIVLAIEQMRLRPPGEPWLIPIRFDDCNVPDWDIGGGRTIGSIHRADLFGDDLHRAAERLVTAVNRILHHQTAAP